MQFRILGPIEALVDDQPAALGAPKQRGLLALLLVNRRRVMTAEQLIDGLWGEAPPASAVQSLQVYVHGLRRALGADRIETAGRGYRVVVGEDELDLDRFERTLERGRAALEAGRADDAADDLREALAVWRGPALADLPDETRRAAEAERLEELRFSALELRFDAELACGRHDAVVAELEALTAERAVSRAVPPAADARALPLRPPGGRARGLSRRPRSPRGGSRPRSEPGPAGAGAGDPPAGPEPRRSGSADPLDAASAGAAHAARRPPARARGGQRAVPRRGRAARHPHRPGRHGQDENRAGGRARARARAPRRCAVRQPRAGLEPGAPGADDRGGARRARGRAGPGRGCDRASARAADAARAGQLRADPLRCTLRRRPARRGPARVDPGHEPRAVAAGRRARVPGAAVRDPERRPSVRGARQDRRSAPLHGPRAGGRPGVRARHGQRTGGRPRLQAARRTAARNRAGRGAREAARAGRDPGAARARAEHAAERPARRARAPADARRHDPLELRPARPGGAPGVRAARRLRRRLHAGGCRGRLRRDTREPRRPGRQQPAPATGGPLHDARDGSPLRRRAAGGGRGRASCDAGMPNG